MAASRSESGLGAVAEAADLGFKGLSKGAVTEDALKKPSGGGPSSPQWAGQRPGAALLVPLAPRKTGHCVSCGIRVSGAAGTAARGCGGTPLEADTAGCDGLHWLDGTIFRPCCDAHDICYAKSGCNQWSWWWPSFMSWNCSVCNSVAVYCFYSTLGVGSGTCIYMPGACFW